MKKALRLLAKFFGLIRDDRYPFEKQINKTIKNMEKLCK